MKMYETIAQLLKLCSEQDIPLWKMILKNERKLSEASEDVIWKRLSIRNQTAGENAVFYVGRKEFDEWAGLFEAPAQEELDS